MIVPSSSPALSSSREMVLVMMGLLLVDGGADGQKVVPTCRAWACAGAARLPSRSESD
jgi:hypothetical protein